MKQLRFKLKINDKIIQCIEIKLFTLNKIIPFDFKQFYDKELNFNKTLSLDYIFRYNDNDYNLLKSKIYNKQPKIFVINNEQYLQNIDNDKDIIGLNKSKVYINNIYLYDKGE